MNKDLRRQCAEAVMDEAEQLGDAIHPLSGNDGIEVMRGLRHIHVVDADISVDDLVDIIIDTIREGL